MTMPDFLVIGVTKAGTTSVYAYLTQHPQIAMSKPKEPHFFAFGEADQPPSLDRAPRRPPVSTLAAYQALFARMPAMRLRGEASTSNIEARACVRIGHYLPHARFICLLRQPVDRAYSAFAMFVRLGVEPERDFHTAYLDSPRRWDRRFDECLPPYACDHAGWYVNRLSDWLARFPRQQLQINLYDDLKSDPAGTMRGLYAFLEVDDSFVPDLSQVNNQGAGVRSMYLSRLVGRDSALKRWLKPWLSRPMRRRVRGWLLRVNRTVLPPLDPELRRELTWPQHADILRLQDLIGRDLTHWLAQ